VDIAGGDEAGVVVGAVVLAGRSREVHGLAVTVYREPHDPVGRWCDTGDDRHPEDDAVAVLDPSVQGLAGVVGDEVC